MSQEVTARKSKARRVTADLPPQEFDLIEVMRVREAASTTDLTRALVRLYHSAPEFARLVHEEIGEIRREKSEARERGGSASAPWQRRRGSMPHARLTGGRSVA
ncbi:hypothetical protein [Streptomyces sp. NPDC087294]|uniref:hypothetical protein n=1 Tax=Streptomyces sp. NPDC087294 TaxID=3365777 RepID=UPI00380DD01B